MDHDFQHWVGRSEAVDDALALTQSQAAQATLDEGGPPLQVGDPLPLPWHWFHFLPRAATSELDADGHPRRGDFLPPIPYPRRMFAGARLQVHRPLRIGLPALRQGTVRAVTMKSGKSGALAFVSVHYRFMQEGVLCLEEEQDIVYREPGAPVAAPVQQPWPALPDGAWQQILQPDPRLLFRFSALTFNAHRIHYDRPYALADEGYPGLVVHGPLTAALLLQLLRRNCDRPVLTFSFRALAPLFDLAPVRLQGVQHGDSVELLAQGPDGSTALAATATLGDRSGSGSGSEGGP